MGAMLSWVGWLRGVSSVSKMALRRWALHMHCSLH